jgi:uncharacterized protein YdaT
MPWTGKQFKQRHAHALSSGQANKAAKQANAILRSGGNEGTAIATAIKNAKGMPKGRRADRWYGKK